MADPQWTSYVGMVSGIVGSITGIAGAIMGYVSYRKSNQIKTRDLRIEVKQASVNTIFDFKKLCEQMVKGNTSRRNITAAKGMLKSSMMDIWKNQYELDQITANNLRKEIPAEATNYDNLNPKELEDKLIELHRMQSKIRNLSEKYSETMALDAEQGKQLREDKRAKSRR
jgi:hypothetical protein